VTIPSGSPFIGQTIDQSGLIHQFKLGMLSLQRQDTIRKPLADTVLESGDTLIVEGTRDSILSLSTIAGVEISGRIQ